MRPPHPSHRICSCLCRQLVVSGHVPRAPAELALCPGDRVLVLHDTGDGWLAGRDRGSGTTGLFPAACLHSAFN